MDSGFNVGVKAVEREHRNLIGKHIDLTNDIKALESENKYLLFQIASREKLLLYAVASGLGVGAGVGLSIGYSIWI